MTLPPRPVRAEKCEEGVEATETAGLGWRVHVEGCGLTAGTGRLRRGGLEVAGDCGFTAGMEHAERGGLEEAGDCGFTTGTGRLRRGDFDAVGDCVLTAGMDREASMGLQAAGDWGLTAGTERAEATGLERRGVGERGCRGRYCEVVSEF